jgi:taurine dioxygenase
MAREALSMFKITPLSGEYDFGVVVEGLDIGDVESANVRRRLRTAWIENGLLVFRGFQGGRDTQLRLSQVFGELEIHPLELARLPEQPQITPVPYNPGQGAVCLVDGEERGAYLPWHSDLIYVERINHGGILRSVQTPRRGGYTGFIDQIERYAALPDYLKAQIEGLSVVYRYNHPKIFGKPLTVLRDGLRASADPEEYGFVAHPMVYIQPETGRKVLNVSPWFAVRIENMSAAASDELLSLIVAHCEDDTCAYYHRWAVDDMVLWDNWRMLHCSYGVPPDEPRYMERTTLKGDYELGRLVSSSTRPRKAPVSG